jgi:hypothetical protein
MKATAGLGLIAALAAPGTANAQEGETPRSPVLFQMALRTGVAVPMGRLTGAGGEGTVVGIPHDDLDDFVSVQVPIVVEAGAKILPSLFVGGYLGVAFGQAAGASADDCDQHDLACNSLGFRLGVEGQYHIRPRASVSPWFGYGVGFEWLGLSVSSRDDERVIGYWGLEFAHLMAGADFRIDRLFQVGPVVDFALGTYTHLSVSGDGIESRNSAVADTALHEWLTLGVRVVFSP